MYCVLVLQLKVLPISCLHQEKKFSMLPGPSTSAGAHQVLQHKVLLISCLHQGLPLHQGWASAGPHAQSIAHLPIAGEKIN
jgi:hypothetical protein